MHFLLVNDDGIQSSFLRILAEELTRSGHEVTVSAPAAQQSAKSHAFTIQQPVIVHRASFPGAAQAWAVEGTPVDSVRLGLMELCDRPVDLVLSGINCGYNAGLSTFVSGTIGAAREAAFQTGKALALSVEETMTEAEVRSAAAYSVRLAENLASAVLPSKCVCSINYPRHWEGQCSKPIVCEISHAMYLDRYERRVSPRGDEYYWLAPYTGTEVPAPDTDLYHLSRGFATCSLLTPDGTAGSDGSFLPDLQE